jgi:pimeloyl-ACP methyl ester carboxylesterase
MATERKIPLYTLDGVDRAEKSAHPLATGDGLGLSLQRFRRADCDDVVVLVHGLTSSSDMFIMPEHRNLVGYLLDNGLTDVWCLDFRMSNRFAYNLYPNRWSLDDVALYDHPAAIAKVREVVGAEKRIHVVGHCLGSMSFAMALAAGTVTGIASFVSNSIALTPYVPTWSRIKLAIFPFILERLLDIPYVSPTWAYEPRLTRGKLLAKLIGLFHRECDEPACHTLSLMWGSGLPALFLHENLHEVTHRRLKDLFGGTGLGYHRHIAAMVKAGHRAVKRRRELTALPDDYLAAAPAIRTPILFVAGDRNRVFTDSNVHCYDWLREHGANHHELAIVPDYGHQDVFMGKQAATDTFPPMLAFIRRQGELATMPRRQAESA